MSEAATHSQSAAGGNAAAGSPAPSGGAPAPRLLSRAAGDGRRAAPVRLVHLGLGNFFRAHQAWYTSRAPDAAEWGIAAFTGRSADLADRLAAQDGLYTLVTRSPAGNDYQVIDAVSQAHPGDDGATWWALLRAPQTSAVTLTVTEAGYRRGEDGEVNRNDPVVAADVEALRRNPCAAARSIPGRLVAGLAARRMADAGPITIVPCDNLPDNGAAVRRVVLSVADMVDAELATWIADSVSFVATMVDRITPQTTDRDVADVLRDTGRVDRCPVVTEAFSEWVLAGEFPAGRPRWEDAGAQIVPDVAPFEERKLWLLNGAHSLLAYAGSIRGHATVADAMADDTCRDWVRQWWGEASAHLPLPAAEIARYTDALLDRFENPRMRHLLVQIAADGSQKLPVRVLPVLAQERAHERIPLAGTLILAAWVLHLRGMGAAVTDADADRVLGLAAGPLSVAVTRLMDYLDPAIGADAVVCATVLAHAEALARS